MLIAVGRVAPDLVRVVYPLSVFGYVTNGDGVVVSAPAPNPKPPRRFRLPAIPGGHGAANRAAAPKQPAAPARKGDLIRVGDRVRIDRITPYDRKPGLAGVGFTYDNPDRYLPIERGGRERILHLVAQTESPTARFLEVLRILLFLASVSAGAILFLIKPSIATAGFFLFCVGTPAPSTYIDTVVPNPWRPLPGWVGRDAARHGSPGAAAVRVLPDRRRRGRAARAPLRLDHGAAGPGDRHAAGRRRLAADLRGRPAQGVDDVYRHVSSAVTVLTLVVFAIAFVRGRGAERRRAAWIASAFVLASAARLASDAFFPARIPLWVNRLLLSTSIVPIVAVWIAVVRHRFFNVDFVVSRGMVFVALSAAFVGVIAGVVEELLNYVFIYNSNLAYVAITVVSTSTGCCSLQDRRFRRPAGRPLHLPRPATSASALEFIGGYILDAETTEDVYRALLQDAAARAQADLRRHPHPARRRQLPARREPELAARLEVRLAASDELIRSISASRGALSFSASSRG